jgi:hypothetical protein
VSGESDAFDDVVFVLCGLIFCEGCRCEVEYESQHPEYSDEAYRDQAAAMRTQGWVAGANWSAYCPTCASKCAVSPGA